MLTAKEFFTASGLTTEHKQIKLVKHVDHADRSIREIVDAGYFDAYQAEQGGGKRPFDNCEVIISFIALQNNLAEFLGVYRVLGSRPYTRKDNALLQGVLASRGLRDRDGNRKIWYELEELTEFSELRGRLIIQWNSTRGWVQGKDLELYEIQPPNSSAPFPGYQDVFLTHEQLRKVLLNPRAHKDWQAALRANAGIYRIIDMFTGEIYIGSAYGVDGLWGRWLNYAKSGHGGNKLLRERNPEHFRWSVVRTLSRSMSEREVIAIEQREKVKHGSRAHGLNGN